MICINVKSVLNFGCSERVESVRFCWVSIRMCSTDISEQKCMSVSMSETKTNSSD